MKKLNELLELYKPKSRDEQRFVDKHVVVKNSDRNGNGDDVFQATNVKKVDRKKEKHGHEPKEDEKVYEETIGEVLKPSMGAAAYIKDFVKSDDPRFKGDTKKKKIKRALAAYYSDVRKEEISDKELDRLTEQYYEVMKEKSSTSIARSVAEQYSTIEETTEIPKSEILKSLLENKLNEKDSSLVLSIFEKLSEENKDDFIVLCSVEEGLNQALDFCINNRGE